MMYQLLADRAADVRASVSPAALRLRLLHWYRRKGRRLPWRGTLDPYRVWVSEVMLQQTQVATAIPFYQRFIGRFPTLESLARSRAPEVLAVWSGLGYYRRAKHLLAAARFVVREHAGRIPDDPDRFGRLPGVGRYTAGAVLSIAFGKRLPVLDGNVARVLSRLYALKATIRNPQGARELWELAAMLVPMRRPGDWNQALMELGALVCLPRGPKCADCPIRGLCRARALGRIEELPPSVARRQAVKVRRAVALIQQAGRLVLVRRDGPLLAGLWEPPGVDLAAREPARKRLEAELGRLGLMVQLERTPMRIRHRITHRDIEVEVWRAELPGRERRSARYRLVSAASPSVAISALARKVAQRVGERQSSPGGPI